ncbi:hypothetical protein [Rheinheimera fenheensis]|uniref:hypothetical protein n=1 Tax=Rheinheimera fenheensis TaxID=3152295 RepID=UPI003261C062
MNNYEVEPYVGIGPVKLGMTRREVRELMGEPSAVQDAYEKWGIKFPDKDYFYENCFQISYSERGTVNFIEASMNFRYCVVYLGLDVHRTAADKVISQIQKIASPDMTAREYPMNQLFPEIDVSIYREEMERIEAFGISISGYRNKSIS